MKNKAFLIVSLFIFWSDLTIAQSTQDKKLVFSFSERIRLTSFDNTISLNDESESWNFSRFRSRLGLAFLPKKSVEIKMALANESRIWFSPKSKKSRFDEIFVDQLYFKWKGTSKIPLELTAGRQNIMLDEGFICMDAQPLTGSRSIYFNALKAVYNFNKHQITAFVSNNPQTDTFLPLINENKPIQLLEEQSNTGIGFYYKTKLKTIHLSTYYFNKITYKNADYPFESKTNTLGARIELPIQKNIAFTTEAAYQFGKAATYKQNAFGGYFHLDFKLNRKIPLAHTLTLGGFYLSGDNPSTTKNEGWNPLWSRWPKWSESYIYTLILENKGKVAYWSNIASLNTTLKGNISEKISFVGSYYYLLALEDNESAFTDGSGKIRGDLFIVKINYKIDKNWTGHLLWESFTPGNFYPSSANGYNWLRFEILFKI